MGRANDKQRGDNHLCRGILSSKSPAVSQDGRVFSKRGPRFAVRNAADGPVNAPGLNARARARISPFIFPKIRAARQARQGGCDW